MRSTRRSTWAPGPSLSVTIILFLLSLPGTSTLAQTADDADQADEYDVKARVVRISLLAGNVDLKRNDNTDWERARLNVALVEGDTVATTNSDARVEIQIDARNFVRLGANSVLKIVTLRDEGVALSVVAGTASIRLSSFDPKQEYFEVDAPKTTLAAEKTGLYRIDVSREGRVRLAARDGGRARIYSETSGFALRDGRTAELVYEGADAGDWEFVAANASDSWDNWVNERERYLAERSRYDVQYYDSGIWGAEELDAYGDWAYVNDYGWIWRPHTTVINNYYSWAPYRYGSWVWVSPYGWTWVGNEPWGWAPYHYGRWVYYNNYWAWCPRGHYYGHRSWWRPALVAFSISFGDNICWYPLPYHHRDPRARNYRGSDHGHDRLRPMRPDEAARLRRIDPAYYRAVTAQAAQDFGAGGARLRAADEVLARRAITAEPLRTDLPVRPAHALAESGLAGNRSERVTVARPARVAPPSETTDRPTGAAPRSPGVALDGELRRTRILNGRQGLPAPPELSVPTAGAGGIVDTRPTGAVARPSRSPEEPRVEPRSDSGRNRQLAPETVERPTRVERTPPLQHVPAQRESSERAPVRVPVRPPANESGSPADRPARPDNSERPVRVERPERSERPEAPVRRPDPPPRNDPPRNVPPPRSDPPPRNDPPPVRRSESREDRIPAKVKDPR